MSEFFSLDSIELISAICAVLTTAVSAYTTFRTKESRNLFIKLIRPKASKEKFWLYKNFYSSSKQTTIIERAVFILNLSLAKSLILTLDSAFGMDDESKKANTIVGMLLVEKMKRSSSILIALLLAVLIDLTTQKFSDYGSNGYVTLIAVALWSAIMLDHKIIELRIRKGWYGKNEFEAREIINFALAHANKDDFNDQGGLKRIVPLPDIPETETSPSRAWGTHA